MDPTCLGKKHILTQFFQWHTNISIFLIKSVYYWNVLLVFPEQTKNISGKNRELYSSILNGYYYPK